jgi:protein-tyrosine phosphatase
MVDIHSHILPEVDDGARSWDMAVQMCQMAAQDGIEHMVATPHANHEYPYSRQQFSSLLHELDTKIKPRIGLTLGCDFHFSFENLEDLVRNPGSYTIGTTPYTRSEIPCCSECRSACCTGRSTDVSCR